MPPWLAKLAAAPSGLSRRCIADALVSSEMVGHLPSTELAAISAFIQSLVSLRTYVERRSRINRRVYDDRLETSYC